MIVLSAMPSSAAAQPEGDEGEEVVAVEDADEETADDEVEPSEEEDDLGLEDPSRPAPAGKGVVWGTLRDDHGDPLIEAEVSVVGTDIKTVTDFDGNYRLELPPGTYDLRFWYELHEPTQLQGVQVTGGELVRMDEKLRAQAGAVEVIEIETKTESSSNEGQILERKRSASVGDSVGRAEMARQGDKSAADSATRVVGITVEGSRFVFIRGLGERYTNALLDGAPLPSPEPDRQAVPFDLFPSLMLDGMTVAKTFTPDSPGDFAGASVRITTRRVPDEFLFSVSLGAGLNTQSTFRQGLTYRGGSLDWLGIDDGKRALAETIPDYKVARGLPTPTDRFISPAELAQHGRAVNTFMSTQRTTFPVDHNGNVVIGNSWDLGGDSRIGVMAALSYGRSFRLIDDEVVRTFGVESQSGGLRVLNDLKVERGVDNVQWGGPINEAGGTASIEGLTTDETYGGNDPADSSGILRYVRIEFSGIEISPDNEINGLTMGGVGSGTTIDHVQVRYTLDDCFEFFGGTVNASHLVCYRNDDDAFDFDEGYVGNLQFLFAQANPGEPSDANGFESDNDGTTPDAAPRTNPTIYNVTLCGQNGDSADQQYGFLFRRGFMATIGNAVVSGWEAGVDVRDAPDTDVTLSSAVFFGNVVNNIAYVEDGSNEDTEEDDDGGFDEVAWFNGSTDTSVTDPMLADCFAATPDPRPASQIAGEAPAGDAFFDTSATYIGAFKDASDDWMTGAWISWTAN